MSTQSATGFEWSVKLIGDNSFYVGIATLTIPGEYIYHTDRNSILYFSNHGSPIIRIGTNEIHSDLTKQKTGDVIHFKFQPVTKKLVIELVRIRSNFNTSTQKFRMDVTKLICKTTFIIFLLFNPEAIQLGKPI